MANYIASDIVRINKKIINDGYACVSVMTLASSTIECHHYTVGLTNQGRPEIFISGRLPTQTAYAMIQKLVKVWDKKLGVKLGLMPNFITFSDKSTGPATTRYVDIAEIRKEDPSFLDTMDAVISGDKKIVQLLWPDASGILPTSKNYSYARDYRQQVLPEVACVKGATE